MIYGLKMKISRYVFGAKLMALVALLCITMDCAAITPLLEADFSWKNTSVSGKRMSVYSIFMDSNNIAWLVYGEAADDMTILVVGLWKR